MTHQEAVIKALVWRFLVAIPVSFLIVFLFTGELVASSGVAIVLNIVQTILYYFYEFVWFRAWHGKRDERHRQG